MKAVVGTSGSTARRGIGALYFIAVGVIVVLAAVVGINQMISMTSATRDQTAVMELTRKTTLLAESAVEEGAYGALAFDLNNPNGPADGLFLKLRQYLAPQESTTPLPAQAPVFGGATPFIVQATYAPQLTYDAIKNDAVLKLSASDPVSNPVYYGPLDWQPITSQQSGQPLVLMPESNESVGIMGFAHTVSAKGVGLFKELDQSVEFSRPYKCLLMGPPWPYAKYALFVLEFYGDTPQMQAFREKMTIVDPLTTPGKTLFASRGPVKSGFAAFYRKALWHTTVVKYYTEAMKLSSRAPTPIPTASINIDLNSPVVFEGDANGAVLAPLMSNDPAVAQLHADFDPQGLCGEDISIEEWLRVFPDITREADLARIVDALVKIGNDLKTIGAKLQVRNVTPADHQKYFASGAPMPAYNAVCPQAWMSRATRIYSGQQDLNKLINKDSTAYDLAGVYYFQGPGPYVLDKPYTGKGVLVFEDSVTVSNFAPVSDPRESHAVVVCIPTPGKVDTNAIVVTGDVTADLLAPYGTVTAPGSSPSIPTSTIRGSVLVRFLADASPGSTATYFESSSAAPMFPTIDRGAKADYEYEPFRVNSPSYNKSFARHLQVFLDPGYVKKLYWSKRDRQ
ncbi:MAG: hypothetical protein HY815_08120 [Candidatus Riflebacteria bacterium]|nr:hypothetical protein [Candidatus Riflebacteria bacterium]